LEDFVFFVAQHEKKKATKPSVNKLVSDRHEKEFCTSVLFE